MEEVKTKNGFFDLLGHGFSLCKAKRDFLITNL